MRLLVVGTPAIFGSQYGLHYEIAGVPKINGRIPKQGGGGQGWGFVGPAHAPHPNLQTAWLRFVCSRDGQYQYDLTYGGVVVVAWADIFFHDTSRFVPHDPNKNADLKVMPAFRQILPATQNVGEVGYFEELVARAKRAGRFLSDYGTDLICAGRKCQRLCHFADADGRSES